MATSYQRGHLIECTDGKTWHYKDNGEPAEIERPCVRCGQMPTPEGYDACLGEIPGVKAACCGHGVTKPYIFLKSKKKGE